MKSDTNRLRKCGSWLAVMLALAIFSPAFAEGDDEKYFDSLLDAADKIGLVDEIKDKVDPTKSVRDNLQAQSEALQSALKDNLESEVLRLLYEKYGYDTAEKAEAAYKKITSIFDTINTGLEWTDYAIGKYSQVANGQYEQLAVDLWKEGLNKAASTEMAKEIFAKLGVGSNVVGLAVKALELTADSYIALNNETKGARLEALYGSLESDKKLFKGKSSGRKLGEGNPIPVTREAVDYLYNRITTETGFRNQFQIYYEQQLNRTFPTPDFFSSMWIAYQTGGGGKAGAAVADATQDALKKNRAELEEGIRALLAQLNVEAKVRESAVVAQNQLQEIKRLKDKLLTLKVQARIRADDAKTASGQVPAMQAFLNKIPADIQEARKAKSADKLGARRANIVEYVRGPVKALPQGAVRRDLVSKFRSAWVAVSKAKVEILKEADAAYTAAELKRVTASLSSDAAPMASRTDYGLATPLKFSVQLKDLTVDVDRAINSLEINNASAMKMLEKAKADAEMDSAQQSQKIARQRTLVRDGYKNRAVPYQEIVAEQISYEKFIASLGAAGKNFESQYQDLYQQYFEYSGARHAKLEAEERALLTALQNLENEAWQFVQTVVGDSMAQFGNLKDIQYAGLPKIAPPKWDAVVPTKLLQYLSGLRQNIERERDSVLAAKAVWDSAKQRAEIILAPSNKVVVAEFRSRSNTIQSLYSQRRLLRSGEKGILDRVESSLKTFDVAYQRAGNINFKPAEEQAGAPDVEKAYVQGLINQVETISAVLARYNLMTVKYRGAKVTLAVQGIGFDMGLNDPSRVMNAEQVKQLPSQLLAAVDAVGFSSFDDKAGVSLKAFIANEFAKYQQASGLSHLAAFYSGGELNVVTAQDLKGLLSTINSVTANSGFVSSMNGKLKAKETEALEMQVAYGVGDKPPTFNLGKLQQLQSAKDGDIQATARTIQTAVNNKIAEYRKWEQDEAKRAEDNAKIVADCSKKGGIILDGKCANIGGPGGTGLAQNLPPGVGKGGGGTGTQPPGGPGTGGAQTRSPSGQQASGPGAMPSPGTVQTGPSPGTGANLVAPLGAPGGPGSGPSQAMTPPIVGPGSQTLEAPATVNSGLGPSTGQAAAKQLEGRLAGPVAATSQTMPTQIVEANAARPGVPNSSPSGMPAAPGMTAPVAPQSRAESRLADSEVPKPVASAPSASMPTSPPMTTAPTQPKPGVAPMNLVSANTGSAGLGQNYATSPQVVQSSPSAQASNRPQTPTVSESGTSEGMSKLNPPKAASSPSSSPAPNAAAKPVDKELEAQWKEMNKSDSRPPIAMAAAPMAPRTPASPGASTPPGSGPATGGAASPPPGTAAPAADVTPAVRDIYQKFADAYQRKDARGIVKHLAPQWQGPAGLSAQDFEDGLANSFKTFDTIQFKMEGLQIQKSGTDTFNVSYAASLSGKNSKQKIDDRVSVQDVVKITAEGPRIVKTTGSIVIKAK